MFLSQAIAALLKLRFCNKYSSFLFLKDGGTPFFVACQCNHIEVADCLLKTSADIHVQVELIPIHMLQRHLKFFFAHLNVFFKKKLQKKLKLKILLWLKSQRKWSLSPLKCRIRNKIKIFCKIAFKFADGGRRDASVYNCTKWPSQNVKISTGKRLQSEHETKGM